jgi:TRAP-type C4-dicarboxylate transport system permease small subunit
MEAPRTAWVRWLEHLLVIGLCVMGLMIFSNVVLRYVFDDGIAITEEVSRFIFVWLTFIGAVVAMKEGLHLGMENLARNLSRPVRIASMVLSHALMLLCCGVLLVGSWTQTRLNIHNVAALSGIPVAAMYGVGIVASLCIGWILLRELPLVFRGIEPHGKDSGERQINEA